MTAVPTVDFDSSYESSNEVPAIDEADTDPLVWSSLVADYVPLSEYRRMEEAATVGSKKKKRKKHLGFSKKFASLTQTERRMYWAVDKSGKELLDGCSMDRVPHELLMIVMLYSQGFKFSKGDYVLAFKSGVLDPDGAWFGRVLKVVQLTDAQKSTMFSRKAAKTDFGFRISFGGLKQVLPLNLVFSTRVVMDGKLYNLRHARCRNIEVRVTDERGRGRLKSVLKLHLTREGKEEIQFDSSTTIFAKPAKWRRKLKMGYNEYESAF